MAFTVTHITPPKLPTTRPPLMQLFDGTYGVWKSLDPETREEIASWFKGNKDGDQKAADSYDAVDYETGEDIDERMANAGSDELEKAYEAAKAQRGVSRGLENAYNAYHEALDRAKEANDAAIPDEQPQDDATVETPENEIVSEPTVADWDGLDTLELMQLADSVPTETVDVEWG